MNRRSLLALVPALVLLLISDARAGTAGPVSFTAQAKVNANCTVSETGTLDFGSYDPLTNNLTTDQPGNGASLTIRCTRGSHPLVSMDNGAHLGAGPLGAGRRALSAGAGANQQLTYDLVQPTANGAGGTATATTWGAGGGTPGAKYDVGVTTVAPGTNIVVNIFGVLPAGQDAAVAASYTDTVNATVEF